MSHAGLMVGVSGIRGRVGEALTPEVVATYASAFGAWALSKGGSKQIVVGRDSRVSGPMVQLWPTRLSPGLSFNDNNISRSV